MLDKNFLMNTVHNSKNVNLSQFEISEELTKTNCSGAIYRTKYTRRINPTATTEVFQRSQFGVDCEIKNLKFSV